MLKLLRKVNWTYALGELILIFLGINLAIWFNNWNEAKKQKQIEYNTLAEIRDEILLDTIDVNYNIRAYERIVERYDTITHYIWNRLPYDSVLQNCLGSMLSNFSITFHYSAYETLKSRGLETITNDSIRKEIVRLYDFDYQNMERYENNEYSYMEAERITPPHLKKHLTFVRKGRRLEFGIKDYDAFLNDEDFLFVHFNLYLRMRNRIKSYKAIQDKMLTITQQIEQELENF